MQTLMIRLFAALSIPEAVADALIPLQAGVPGAGWRPKAAFHITLRFFGEVDEGTAERIDDALGAVRMKPFVQTLQGVGAFADADRLRAIYAAAAAGEPLVRLASKCEAAARRGGLKMETRSYRPHVTLAYLKGADPTRTAAWIARHNLFISDPWTVSSFGLYSSRLGRSGSVYHLEREYSLA